MEEIFPGEGKRSVGEILISLPSSLRLCAQPSPLPPPPPPLPPPPLQSPRATLPVNDVIAQWRECYFEFWRQHTNCRSMLLTFISSRGFFQLVIFRGMYVNNARNIAELSASVSCKPSRGWQWEVWDLEKKKEVRELGDSFDVEESIYTRLSRL